MNRRDLLLQQMNIPQWALVKPQVLKGDAQIRVANNVKLIVVCEENHQQSQLFQDILRTLELNTQEYQWFDLEQASRLSFDHNPIFLAIQPPEQAVRFTKKFAKMTIWQYKNWQQLQKPDTKRQFWQQIEPICTHFEDLT